METFEARLKRFLFHSPNEIFLTILNSISNFELPELRAATDQGLHNLAVLGAHAVVQTISEQIYMKTGPAATKFYLEKFVDQPSDAVKFADISIELHSFRNVHAHRWSSRTSHYVGFDTTVAEGWNRSGNDLHLNPVVLIDRFIAGFKRPPMWKLPRALDALIALRQKYRYLRFWLELAPGDSLGIQMKAFENHTDLSAAQKDEPLLQSAIATQFGLDTL